MPKKPKKIFDDKLNLIESLEDNLKKSYSASERWLLSRLINDMIPELDVENGQIKNNNSNINKLVSKLNAIFRDLRTGRNADIVDDVLKGFGKISKSNAGYFAIASEFLPDKFKGVNKSVEKIMRKSLGFDPAGKIIADSFIDTIGKNNGINQQLREQAIRSIQSGKSVKDFTDQLKDQILTDKDGLGVLNKHYGPTVSDRYAQYDRAESKEYADKVGMKAFIYAGGRVRDTRKFCCQRNSLVFTTEEAQKWTSLKFAGKNTGYSPLIDLGGYNCRHSTQWISNRAAARLRKDLDVNDKGELIFKKGERKQRLNKC